MRWKASAWAILVGSVFSVASLAAGVETKPRVVVLTDIGNEPDDQMSLVRLLLYSNEIDIEGLVAVTSTWQKNKLSPEIAHGVIDAYRQVRPTLLKHANGWPTADALTRAVVDGQPAFGMAATGTGKTSAGARLIVECALRDDDRPLWISVWGGANTLAQALIHARATLTGEPLNRLLEKLRVYSISDQDDAGPWIRREFPTVAYIVKPSPPDSQEYPSATWTGISGDEFYRNGDGADFTTVSHDWLDRNIRSKAPMGTRYPRYVYIMEGDTPAFLNLIDNGLDAARSPAWGGWGGRYLLRQPYGESRSIWTQGGDSFSRVTSADTVTGKDGRRYTSDQATIWRWRAAFQNDFAARMDWTVKERAQANHAPVVMINGSQGTQAVELDISVGESVTLNAAGTSDPDGDAISFEWFHYPEAGAGSGAALGVIEIDETTKRQATVTATATCQPNWLGTQRCGPTGVAHVILAVTDRGTPPLTRYRRAILTIRDVRTSPVPQR